MTSLFLYQLLLLSILVTEIATYCQYSQGEICLSQAITKVNVNCLDQGG